jgi:hypothetical protein
LQIAGIKATQEKRQIVSLKTRFIQNRRIKQLYKGRAELFKFFGGSEGRKSAMKMTWHHLVFDEEKQVGAGEFTFEFGSKVHGVAMVKVAEGKISHWREYWYESDLDWEEFIGENKF